jgi:general secretion pathway protein G
MTVGVSRNCAQRCAAFTLIELVVVIMILGILAAVAAPKFFNTSASATENGVRQTLSIVRDAIQMYASQNGGSFPPLLTDGTSAGDFHEKLAPFLRGSFPASPVGTKDAKIVAGGGNPLVAEGASPTAGWMYNQGTGEFICNSTDAAAGAGTTYDKF